MKKWVRNLARSLWPALLVTGCAPKPAPVAGLGELRFPVVVLYSTAYVREFKDVEDLKTMGVQTVINSSAPPTLVDSEFKIYTLEKLQSVHGGLWLMANPAGQTEVSFELTRAGTQGLEAARQVMVMQYNSQTWRKDVEKGRAEIMKATTLSKMVDVVRCDE